MSNSSAPPSPTGPATSRRRTHSRRCPRSGQRAPARGRRPLPAVAASHPRPPPSSRGRRRSPRRCASGAPPALASAAQPRTAYRPSAGRFFFPAGRCPGNTPRAFPIPPSIGLMAWLGVNFKVARLGGFSNVFTSACNALCCPHMVKSSLCNNKKRGSTGLTTSELLAIRLLFVKIRSSSATDAQTEPGEARSISTACAPNPAVCRRSVDTPLSRASTSTRSQARGLPSVLLPRPSRNQVLGSGLVSPLPATPECQGETDDDVLLYNSHYGPESCPEGLATSDPDCQES